MAVRFVVCIEFSLICHFGCLIAVYCATGYEVDESRVETCMPCERGKYKDNMGSTRFDMCQSCDEGKTTDFIAAVSSDNCSVRMYFILISYFHLPTT